MASLTRERASCDIVESTNSLQKTTADSDTQACERNQNTMRDLPMLNLISPIAPKITLCLSLHNELWVKHLSEVENMKELNFEPLNFEH